MPKNVWMGQNTKWQKKNNKRKRTQIIWWMCSVWRVFWMPWILIIIVTVVLFASLIISFFPSISMNLFHRHSEGRGHLVEAALIWFSRKLTFVECSMRIQWKWLVALKFVRREIGYGWNIKADKLTHAFELNVFVWEKKPRWWFFVVGFRWL